MEKLILAKEGVFPVVKNHKGELINDVPNTGLLMPGTIQGEGKLTGVPSLFIRLSGCNLRCIWQMEDGSLSRCDTSHASFHQNETNELSVNDVFNLVKHNISNVNHVVITGGEPLLQKNALIPLCRKLKNELNVHITLETNGTVFDEELAGWIDMFSISPKLSNSTPTPEKLASYNFKQSEVYYNHNNNRLNTEALQSYINTVNNGNKELQLKFVVGKKEDYKEIKEDYISKLKDLNDNDVLIMPLGATREELAKSSSLALEIAIANRWRYSPRLHIEMFGSKSGV